MFQARSFAHKYKVCDQYGGHTVIEVEDQRLFSPAQSAGVEQFGALSHLYFATSIPETFGVSEVSSTAPAVRVKGALHALFVSDKVMSGFLVSILYCEKD